MKTNREEPKVTHFLNVDLDLRSASDLQPLVAAFGKKVGVLYVGRVKRTYHAHLELAKHVLTADSAIRDFCALIRVLPKAERAAWEAARFRDFSVGVRAAMQPSAVDFVISAETVKAAAELGARIVLTVYAAEEDSKWESSDVG